MIRTLVFATLLISSVASANDTIEPTHVDKYGKLVLTVQPLVQPKTQPTIISQPQPTYILSQPNGHTHTCANGHTWDHSVTAGHTCPTCGLQQWVQDPFPRQVNTRQNGFRTNQSCPNGQCPYR